MRPTSAPSSASCITISSVKTERLRVLSPMPSASKAWNALGPSCMPAPISPISGDCSSTWTEKPWRTSASAAARPPMPPPATITGSSCVIYLSPRSSAISLRAGLRACRRGLFGVADGEGDIAHSLDMAGNLVARLDRTHTFRCARINQVARLQMIELREVGQQFRDIPDQLAEIAGLAEFTIDLQVDGAVAQHAKMADRHDLAAHRRLLKVFAQVPRAALVTRCQLQVAPRHVQASGITVNQPDGLCFGDPKTAGANGHDQFHLKMIVAGAARVGHGGTRFNQCGGCLVEVKRPGCGLVH